MYQITYLNKFDYLQIFTGVVIKAKAQSLIVDINGENHLREINKEQLIDIKILKPKADEL